MLPVSAVFVDWLTVVAPHVKQNTWLRHFMSHERPTPIRPAYHRSHALEYYPSLLKYYYSLDQAEQDSVLVMSGECLAHLRRLHSNDWCNKMVAVLAKRALHFSRIDLAIDLMDEGELARRLAHDVVDGELDFGRRTARVVMGIGEYGGCTTYIGARTSPLFARIYDKKAESKGRISSSRIEFELKDTWAQGLTEQMRAFNGWTLPPRLLVGLLNGFEALQVYPEIQALCYGEVSSVHLPGRERFLGTKDWLERQVLPTFLKDKDGKGGELWDWFKERVERPPSGA